MGINKEKRNLARQAAKEAYKSFRKSYRNQHHRPAPSFHVWKEAMDNHVKQIADELEAKRSEALAAAGEEEWEEEPV